MSYSLFPPQADLIFSVFVISPILNSLPGSKVSSQHLPMHQKFYRFIFWKKSLWSLQSYWYLNWYPLVPSCHLGSPSSSGNAVCFSFVLGLCFLGHVSYSSLSDFPPFGSTAFCSFLRKGVEKQKFCDFPCLKMYLFYLLP